MRIGLVSYRCKDKDISFNMSQIERALRDTAGKVDLLCFGETFLQGFNSLCWDYELDKDVALEKESDDIKQLQRWTEGTAAINAFCSDTNSFLIHNHSFFNSFITSGLRL